MAASKVALKIKHCLDHQLVSLDLSLLGLTTLPPEIGDMGDSLSKVC